MQHLLKPLSKSILALGALFALSCNHGSEAQEKKLSNPITIDSMHDFPIKKSEAEWKKQLSPEQYSVIREKGTERPFTGKFNDTWDQGHYVCAACGNELFSSTSKFNAGCGWPSFYEALDPTRIVTKEDNSLGMRRIEIICAKCGAHLGHVFDDGPKPTGLRYCVNSLSLDFKKDSLPGKK